MRKRADRARLGDKDNRREAIYDLEFRMDMNQWPEKTRRERERDGRPVITINKVPQFIRQVTGDIRQMKPALKAYGVDDKGDRQRAEVVTSLLRYIENRSDATDAYFRAVDCQVTAGIGHWRIDTEVCDDETGEQDIAIRTVDDQINVLWDPDATKPSREDAYFCFVPVDLTMDAFKARYPKASVSGFDSASDYRASLSGGEQEWWSTGDLIRIAEYWERRETEGTVEVWRSVVTHGEVLEEPSKRPGKYIPIIPVIGEELRIGDRVVRHGMVRFLRGPQQRYNFWVTAQTEIVALQPKSPFLVTDKQVEDHLDLWMRANHDNLPFLTYTPDQRAPAPVRAQPPLASSGFAEGIAQAAEDMKAVTGIYDASLGQRSNETSGKAILARQREGDVGTYVYVDNFLRALKHTGRVILDMIPSIYDTTRTLRIIGEDGAVDEMKINQPQGVSMEGDDPSYDSDVRIGKYDIFVQPGPSYTTKREEAREGMMAFIQAFPPAAPIIGDLIASAQDWPHADKIAERLKTMLPPGIREKEQQEEGGKNGAPQAAPAPPPEMIAQQVQAEVMQSLEGRIKQAEIALKEAQAAKAQADAQKAGIEMQAAMVQAMVPQQAAPVEPQQPDPIMAIQNKAIEARAMKEIDFEFKQREAKLARDASQMTAIGMDDETAEAIGPSPVDVLMSAIVQQGDATRAGMEALAQGQMAIAQALAAPKRVSVARQADGSLAGESVTVN